MRNTPPLPESSVKLTPFSEEQAHLAPYKCHLFYDNLTATPLRLPGPLLFTRTQASSRPWGCEHAMKVRLFQELERTGCNIAVYHVTPQSLASSTACFRMSTGRILRNDFIAFVTRDSESSPTMGCSAPSEPM